MKSEIEYLRLSLMAAWWTASSLDCWFEPFMFSRCVPCPRSNGARHRCAKDVRSDVWSRGAQDCGREARSAFETSPWDTVDLEFTGVCIMVFYYTGQIVTFQLRRARPQRPSHPLCLSPLRVLYMRWVGEGMHCQGELVKR